MLHVTDLLKGNKCSRFCWNEANDKISTEMFYKLECPFSDLWKAYLGLKEYGQGHSMDTNEISLDLVKNNEYTCFARFEYRELRTKIPVLQRIKGGYRAIYPYLSAYPKESEAVLLKVNTLICASLGVHILENRILYLNKEYVRDENLDLNSLFMMSDCFFNRRNHLSKTIEECIAEQDFDLDAWIDQTKAILEGSCPDVVRSKQCLKGRRCLYYDRCFDEESLVDDSVLFLTTSQHKLKAYEEGIIHMRDLDVDRLEGFRLQYAQYMASVQGGYFMDRAALNSWVSNIQYPISYLDFEWDTFAIPPYKNMKPFDVLCFQYSLHIEDSDGQLMHYDFFEPNDCREDFIRSLIERLPSTGSILVYNMEGAEKLRLLQLAEQFDEYKEQINSICARMIDLSKPFEAGLFYHNKMRGHYSLKNLLPVFSDDVSYHDLSIQDGMNAVYAYRTYDSIDDEQKQQVRKDISTYCQMDTYAEYIVYHGILNLLKEDF